MAFNMNDPYTFSLWSYDVGLQNMGDNRGETGRAVAVAQALPGTAYEWVRHGIPQRAFVQGGVRNGQPADPVTCVLYALASKYAEDGED